MVKTEASFRVVGQDQIMGRGLCFMVDAGFKGGFYQTFAF